MLCLPRIVGAWHNNTGLMLHFIWSHLGMKELFWREAQCRNWMSESHSSVPICEIAAGMIRRVILHMKDWLSNSARVKLRSLSGSQPLVVAFLPFRPAQLLLLDDNTIWPWTSGIEAGAAYNQLRLQLHTLWPVLQVSYITRYVFMFDTLVYRLCRDWYYMLYSLSYN